MTRFSFPLLGGRALDILFPRACGVCGTGGTFLCDSCIRRLPEAAPPRCRRCWTPVVSSGVCGDCTGSPLDGARSPYIFDGSARKLVHQLKYEGIHALAEPMGGLLVTSMTTQETTSDVVIPVPLYGFRRRNRGYNQSELLARVICDRTRLPLDIRALRRTRNTAAQQQIPERAQRGLNVGGAFRCAGEVEGRRVLLVDDVLTTGATARECARMLKAAGAISVLALTFCHAD